MHHIGRYAVLALGVALCASIGVFAGNWAWHHYVEANRGTTTLNTQAAASVAPASPHGQQRAAVLAKLANPDSAKFRNERPSSGGPFDWCGEVDAKNQMGSYSGFTRYMVILGDPKKKTTSLVEFDPSADPRLAAVAIVFNQTFRRACLSPPAQP